MKTVARLSAEDRSDLFRNTANRMQMSDAIVEKDFWVCLPVASLVYMVCRAGFEPARPCS